MQLSKIPRKRPPLSHNGPASQCPLPTAWSKPPSSLTGRPPQLPDGSLSRAPTQLPEAAMETIRSRSRVLCVALWTPCPVPRPVPYPPPPPRFILQVLSTTQGHRALPGSPHLSPLLTGQTSFGYQMSSYLRTFIPTYPSLVCPQSPCSAGQLQPSFQAPESTTSLQALFALLPLFSHPNLPRTLLFHSILCCCLIFEKVILGQARSSFFSFMHYCCCYNLRKNLTLYLRLVSNRLCSSSWPQTHSSPPASVPPPHETIA